MTLNGRIAASTFSGSLTGNASTASALQTPRTINGINFDGTSNITVTAAAGTLTGSALASSVTESSLTSVGTLANLTVTNPIAGSITGNAATVTTNANLNGVVTSIGNATSFGTFSSSTLAGALSDETGTGSAVFAGSPTLTGTVSGAAATWSGTDTALSFAATGAGANLLPVGTTGARPTGTNGMLRYNSTLAAFEGYVNGAWASLQSGLVNLSTQVTGTLPAANGGTGQKIYSPADYKQSSDTDDTNSINAALAAANSTCGKVVLDNKFYQISLSSISTSGCATIEGIAPWYTGNDFKKPTYPYYGGGSIIVQNTAATDVFDCPVSGQAVNIKNVGVMWGESIIFTNTGSGFKCTPPALNTALNQGPTYFTWDNLFVFGNDASHYAFDITNQLYMTAGSLWCQGGPCLQFTNFVNSANYTNGLVAEQNGNTEIAHVFASFFVGASSGGGHCINFYNNQSVDSSSISNFYHFGRLQCNRDTYASINGHTLTAPTSSQMNLNANGYIPGFVVDQLDMEPSSSYYINFPSNYNPGNGSFSFSLGFANLGWQQNRDFNYNTANLQSYEAGNTALGYGQRKHFTDLSTRIAVQESSGSTYTAIMDAGQQSLTMATDGTATVRVPRELQEFAGPSGLRISTYAPGIGSHHFDTTVGKIVYYNGSGWVDGAGTSVTTPSSGAASASDSFARTASTLGNSSGGQPWYIYTFKGAVSWQTTGSAAKSSTANTLAENIAYLFTNNSDGAVSVTYSTFGSNPRLLFRVQDRDHFWSVNPTGLYKISNGSSISTSCTYSTFATGDVASVTLSGSSITVKKNGTTLCTLTDTTYQTATGYGLSVYNDTSTVFTNFSVTIP